MPPSARFTDPASSFEAANSIKPEKMRATYKLIIQILGEHGPQADYEIDNLIEYGLQSPSGVRTRRKELERSGYVQYAGYRKRNAARLWTQVWELTAKGKELYQQWTGNTATEGKHGGEEAGQL